MTKTFCCRVVGCSGVVRAEGDDWSRAGSRAGSRVGSRAGSRARGCDCKCVADRDLNLDNVLLSKDSPPVIKLCDFGCARGWGEGTHCMTHISTPVSMAWL